MGFFKSLLDGIVKVGASVVGVAAHYAFEFKEKVREKIYSLQNEKTDISENIDDNRSVNDQIFELQKKYNKDGHLNYKDREKLKRLYQLRSENWEKIESGKEIELAQEMTDNGGAFDSITIDDENLHVLQFHVGQNALGKRCNRCGKAMILQWRRGKNVNSIREIFWGCTGYYNQSCRQMQPVSQTEYNFLTKVDRPEFEISNDKLNKIVELPGSKNNIRRRMSAIKNTGTQEYLCPIHGESMILRENKDQNRGLMEQYFLACPRFHDIGCRQIITIKSAGQLAAVLEKFYGRGIL